MISLTTLFNKCSLTNSVLSMNDLLTSVEKINSEIQIDNLAVLTVVNWIRKNPCHSFPKRKKEWIKTIGGSRHLNRVKFFNSQTRRSEKHYINEENIFNLLMSRRYFYQINNRIYCDRNKIDNESVVYRCSKRKIENNLPISRCKRKMKSD